MAIAASDAHGRLIPPGTILSPEYAFYFAAERQKPMAYFRGLHAPKLYEAIAHDGQPAESAYPYQDRVSAYAKLVLPQVAANAPIYRRSAIPMALADLKTRLMGGITPVLHLETTEGFRDINQHAGVLEYSANDPVVVRHAVVAVGLGKNAAGGEYVMVRNSWGSGWGLNGHGWLSETYLKHRYKGGAYYTP
ncbi:C1 family peptidase [Solimonas terrae]|uniref:Peptidase C1A papain C-terminal domain-containing protein n=1 Tax=Solimonas terrae TaxID=1396819 RepID=A0A6M2BTB8_9GAMM|nr:C1 family peptidase [Solimonas terrae]NGY05614.1 hypothetical protein [Solimonas terrae]